MTPLNRDPTGEECLAGAHAAFLSARKTYLGAVNLRRNGFGCEAVLLLAIGLEEAVKAGFLHRAWLVRDQPELFAKALREWKLLRSGQGAHRRRHAAAPLIGSHAILATILLGLLADLVQRGQSPSATERVFDAMLGITQLPAQGWWATLLPERQAIYVDWNGEGWTNRTDDGAAQFFDEGRVHALMLFKRIRSDLRYEGTSVSASV